MNLKAIPLLVPALGRSITTERCCVPIFYFKLSEWVGEIVENSNQNKKNNFENYSYGRKIIYSSYIQSELNKNTITEILNEVFPIHLFNRSEIDYL